ncbi:hypothetical protein KJ761_00840 [Patescibacteria group bacterium]|nr:hypothetical protein [Patescibacteria group bacterium]
MDFNKLTEKSQEIIQHIDDVEALKLLKQIQRLPSLPDLKQTDPDSYRKLQQTIIFLKIVALPLLTDQEVENILRNSCLESFMIDVPLENRLTAKLFYVPFLPRDELRKKLRKALLENQQKLGPFTISQWLYKFEKNYPVNQRDLSASVDFVNFHPETRALDSVTKKRLKELTHAYDYLLITTLPATGPILNSILSANFSMQKDANDSYDIYNKPAQYSLSESASEVRQQSLYTQEREDIQLENIHITLKQYPEVGEQLVTSQKINLRNFPYPVRPSIKNWLADYTFQLGYEKHESMVRSQYLFQGANTKNLSAPEKNKLAYILKSFDENSPITINKATSQVIFPAADENNLPKNLTDQFRPTANPREEQKNINSMQFSYPQKMPYEKTIAPPAPVKSLPQKFPASPQNLPRNVVDLKNINQ